ncbi:hypothetical protein D9M73_56930 [compost metagenome]
MALDDSLREAAIAASTAVEQAMKKYRVGEVTDEDDLTGVLVGRLDANMEGRIGSLNWSSRILRHRSGTAAEEKEIGADLLIHVSIDTPARKYSKGVLVQAKRVEPGKQMTIADHEDLKAQCEKMLAITPAAFVFDYTKTRMRCASATRISGSSIRELYSECNLTPYRFFFELFRCPIGDQQIKSSRVEELQVRNAVQLIGTSPGRRSR